MKKHANIPVFIPHLGCPNQCVFCNQRFISGVSEFSSERVIPIIDEALLTIDENTETEIAFFGGSFTGIDRALMIELLEIAKGYIDRGKVSSIRCSTRPDYISPEILEILGKYGVKIIELGLQSTSDEVLIKTKRGHSFEDEKRAVKLIVEAGFSLVGQMMIGLPGATAESEEQTADFIINSGAVAARVYPTVVFRDTELATLTELRRYEPLTIDEAVARTAKIVKKFKDAGVSVIRVGLHASENLTGEDTYLAGPNHAALGELCENEIYFSIIKEKLEKTKINENKTVKVLIPRGATSKAVGQKKKNKLRLINEFLLKDVIFRESDTLSDYEVSICT